MSSSLVSRIHRAHGNALPAELAVQPPIKRGGDLGFDSAVDEGIGTEGDYFVADPGAFPAKNAAVHVPFDERIHLIGGQVQSHGVVILTPLAPNPSKDLACKHLRRMIDRENRRAVTAVLSHSRPKRH